MDIIVDVEVTINGVVGILESIILLEEMFMAEILTSMVMLQKQANIIKDLRVGNLKEDLSN
jgi:hypothetical protein